MTRWLLAATLGATVSCSDDSAPTAPSIPEGEPAPEATDWSERLAEPDVETVLAALARPHVEVRAHLGPHRVKTTADFSLAPADEAPTGRPAVDRPVVVPQQLHDETTLEWTEADGSSQLSLSQANDHERGRDVIVVDETVHVRKAHRAWFHYPRDSDVVEQWLDDAQRSVHDVVQLAAPRLSVEASTVEGAGLDDGPAVEITLGLSERAVTERIAAGPTQGWRRDAEIDAIEGTILLDARGGAWLRADVDVRYRLRAADDQALLGHVHLRGEVTPDGSIAVRPPTDSSPQPSRLRYDHEARQLLDGLAAP